MFIDIGCTGSYINQQFIVNHKILTEWMPLAILVYNTDNTLNKNRFIKEFTIL